MNEFREKLLGGKRVETPLLKVKAPRGDHATAEDESLSELAIPREAARVANHRDGDRHRLENETVQVVHDGGTQSVTLVNLSGGGAMIEGGEGLRLWDRVELQLGDWNRVEAAVRWIKNGRVGLEFAHETRIETDTAQLAHMLQTVLERSFPDIAIAAKRDAAAASAIAEDEDEDAAGAEETPELHDLAERELRHPLIWSGVVHYNHDSTPVRLRNISSGGALIEGEAGFPVGAELLLDLNEAGTIFCTVHWARGDTAGLKFHSPYDLNQLAEVRPKMAAARWVAPDYLREDRSTNSPWASQWGRSDLGDLHRSLEATRAAIRRR
ncbi:PilZ domain-containing protein [Sphingomonas astaxanthinifaciens]|uniref:PilZ domain-containing protein n=1 Tax=Sphingomonas astaxanthinifaciens DSM 22298 TaxID=1123267 RepID=A0ABQ5Z2S9_9SPHN|nr:PilZ domain-containing protein [Sphingomonas astaxanthinifaciens]GLR46320.1 hypothetical protein GCM10007925_00310 [Sphingomonas astaxanthinifaciens DSM 22298]